MINDKIISVQPTAHRHPDRYRQHDFRRPVVLDREFSCMRSMLECGGLTPLLVVCIRFKVNSSSTFNLQPNRRWITDGRRAIGHIMRHDGIGADFGMVSNSKASNNHRARANHDIAAQARYSSLFSANRDTMLQTDARPTPHGRINHNAMTVNQDESRSEIGAAPDNAAAKPDIQLIEQHRQRPRPGMPVGCLHQTVNQHGERSIGQTCLQQCPWRNGAVNPFGLGRIIRFYQFQQHVMATRFLGEPLLAPLRMCQNVGNRRGPRFYEVGQRHFRN